MLAHLPHIGRKQEVAGAAVNKDAITIDETYIECSISADGADVVFTV